jgi:hypothetical protein
VCFREGTAERLLAGGPCPVAIAPRAYHELRKELARLTEAEAAVRDDGLEVTGALLDGDAAAELSKATVHLDLLVLGSRGYGPLGAVLLGSVSNTLVRTARCPVVVVPRSITARWRAGTPWSPQARADG